LYTSRLLKLKFVCLDEADKILVTLHEQWGNKWAAIASSIPGKTPNDIKNRWYSQRRLYERARRIQQKIDYYNPPEMESDKRTFDLWTGAFDEPQMAVADVENDETGNDITVDDKKAAGIKAGNDITVDDKKAAGIKAANSNDNGMTDLPRGITWRQSGKWVSKICIHSKFVSHHTKPCVRPTLFFSSISKLKYTTPTNHATLVSMAVASKLASLTKLRGTFSRAKVLRARR
jgi:hypothetical protein